MSRRRQAGRALLAAMACGAAFASPAPASAAGGCSSAAAQQHVAAAVRTARGRYALEARGAAGYAALRTVATDRVLSDALRAGRLGAAQAEALRVVAGHRHITAIRVVRGSRVLVETNRFPFDVAGPETTLRDRHGVVVGTLQLTIQDVVGFIRLVHKYTGAVVVVRGAAGEAKSSSASALAVRLPVAGCASVAGQSYAVRSFGETAFGGEPLTIWVLRSA